MLFLKNFGFIEKSLKSLFLPISNQQNIFLKKISADVSFYLEVFFSKKVTAIDFLFLNVWKLLPKKIKSQWICVEKKIVYIPVEDNKILDVFDKMPNFLTISWASLT